MALLRGAMLASLAAAAAGGTGTVADQARRILSDGAYQKALPQDPAPPDPRRFLLDLGPLAPLARILLFTALAVAVALAIAWLVTRLRGRAGEVAIDEGTAPAQLEVPLEGAERLAAAGRFAEAIHALLLETLAALSRAAQLAPSLTSREILSRVRLPVRARDALAGLVLAVEISRFGGTPAGEGDYRACLERFHAFLGTYRSGRGAPGGTAA